MADTAPPTDPTTTPEPTARPGATVALVLLLVINLFNYIDRQILSAVLPKIEQELLPGDPDAGFWGGLLTSAFLVAYMFLAPVFGIYGDRMSRWWLIGIGVVLWSLASGLSGLAGAAGLYMLLLASRCLVGVGEAAYGPVAPSILADLYSVRVRGLVMSWFYAAIPVGSALGFVLGGVFAQSNWRMAFYIVVIPGVLLGLLCFFLKDPPRGHATGAHGHGPVDLKQLGTLRKIPSYVFCTLGMTALTFLLGGIAAWMPSYVYEREATFAFTPAAFVEARKIEEVPKYPLGEVLTKLEADANPDQILHYTEFMQRMKANLSAPQMKLYLSKLSEAFQVPGTADLGTINMNFGLIVVLSGLGATLLGGYVGDRLRTKYAGSYFLVSGFAMLLSFPAFLAVLVVPFPYAWALIFIAVFFMFSNTGPMNTVLANVVPGYLRSSGFAIHILIIHAFGDAVSPVFIGYLRDQRDLSFAFLVISALIPVAAVFWLLGARHLQPDTDRAEAAA